ncbi:GNAT family N-acetyltransferase [Flexivirga sp. B27]
MRRRSVEVDVYESVSPGESHELWPVYDAIFHDKADETDWLDTWRKHSERNGFRLARARIGSDLVGFAYGYTGESGQWWTDMARSVLEPEVADEWLGGHFELVSIGIVPDARGSGIGRRLLDVITTGLSQDRWLLMTTADSSDPARRLYAAAGWSVIGPGLTAEQVIMGRHADESAG